VWSKLLSTLNSIASPALKELVLVSHVFGGRTLALHAHTWGERPTCVLLPSGAHLGRQQFKGSILILRMLASFSS
jgi:hypothetical protein